MATAATQEQPQVKDSAPRYGDRESSKENIAEPSPSTSPRIILPAPSYSMARLQDSPLSPVQINFPSEESHPEASSATIESFSDSFDHRRASGSRELDAHDVNIGDDHRAPAPPQHTIPFRDQYSTNNARSLLQPQVGIISSVDDDRSDSPKADESWNGNPTYKHSSGVSLGGAPQLQFYQQSYQERPTLKTDLRASLGTNHSSNSNSPISSAGGDLTGQHLSPNGNSPAFRSLGRPASTLSLGSVSRGRTPSPRLQGGLRSSSRGLSANEARPTSYVELLNVPYPQAPPVPTSFDDTHLRTAVGTEASLLGTKKTLDMYRANIKKTNDLSVQYEFAVFMINTAQELAARASKDDASSVFQQPSPGQGQEEEDPIDIAALRSELLKEGRHILQRLSDRSYPFAQYYLADGYASGLFNKGGKEDYDRAFGLFVAASKHGHAEAGYRTAICYEYGWGSRKDPAKAVQFYRQAASKNHPGAMMRLAKACLTGDMGLTNRYREGIKWLKRATEVADFQYNSAPYELGVLHESGYGDDIFKDESYAAQLFTQSADLGHAEANYRLGDAYEHGKLSCPRDPALSVHFYNGAAQKGHPAAMMALCAWYMVGAEPVLEKDENEAYEWAKKAAETGFPKAEYALGYFTEMGIGCRRDPLEANVWYVKAASEGDERAKQRLAVIQAAASGETGNPGAAGPKTKLKKGAGGKEEKECVVM
ncbi:MAG: hypothetical protein M1819_001936 [Sarea resinae]|nr:MAG: hypothetical protein M1819_001936 [Sarea resinae]